MTVRIFAWHCFRIALAAVLIWYDVRLFLFYAFITLLRVSHQVDHLRATIRILAAANDGRVLALCDSLGVAQSTINEVNAKITDEMSEADKRELRDDLRLATGGRLGNLSQID